MTVPSISTIAVQTTSGNLVSPVQVTANAHGLTTGQTVAIQGVVGNTAANTTGSVVTVVDANNFTIPGTGNGAYISGGVVWVAGSQMIAATGTAFDARLVVRVADKSGDTVYGQYTIPANGASGLSISMSASGAIVQANASNAQIRTGTGSRIQLGDNDDILLNTRTRTIMVSCAECFDDYTTATPGGSTFIADDRFGVCGAITNLMQTIRVPLTRLHDGATLLKATLYFFPRLVNAAKATLPTRFPTLQLFRMNPSTDKTLTSMAASGAVSLTPVPKTVGAYGTTSAVGASGNITLVTINSGSASVATGALLTDTSNNVFSVTTGGTFANGAAIPVQAQAPATGTFVGVNTNHNAGDVLTWVTTPANATTSAVVATGGLTGGLNAGYAQSVVFVPDASMSVIDQSTYTYQAAFTTDDAIYSNQSNGAWNATVFTALKLDFGNITSLRPQ